MSYCLCVRCLNVYNKEFLVSWEEDDLPPCPVADCPGYVFEVDEEMILPAMTLIEKGYGIKYCSSGHLFDVIDGGYISFLDGKTPKGVPTGWNKVKDRDIIGYDIPEKYYDDPWKRREIIKKKISNLMKWCDELEPLNGD